MTSGTDGMAGEGIRTFEGVRQQIYSLPPLATWVTRRGIGRRVLNPPPEGARSKKGHSPRVRESSPGSKTKTSNGRGAVFRVQISFQVRTTTLRRGLRPAGFRPFRVERHQDCLPHKRRNSTWRRLILTVAVTAAAVGTGSCPPVRFPATRAERPAPSVPTSPSASSGVYRWGTIDGYTGYSLRHDRREPGDVDLLWIANNNRHPRIPYNAFGYIDGRLIQLAQSWCKDGSRPSAQRVRFVPAGRQRLPRGPRPRLLGSVLRIVERPAEGLAPRSQCNPATGVVPTRPQNLPRRPPSPTDAFRSARSISTPRVAERRYFMDAFYLHPQDYEAGNQLNNAFLPRVRGRHPVSTAAID